MEVLRTAFQTSLVMEWAATAATALVAVQVSFRLIGDRLSFGTALAVLVVTPEFFVPFRRLAIEYHAGQSGDAAATAIGATITGAESSGPESPSPPDTPPVTSLVPAAPAMSSPRVELRGVGYSYPGSDRPALHDLDLEIGSGETVALVGPSGAGKSTVASILLRFVRVDSGEVSIDGTAMDSIDTESWRRRVAWVPQRPTVFSGSVLENIVLAAPGVSRDRVVGAAERAGAAEFIGALPQGFETRLGEGGTTLSGGQRQRLAIARAFLRDAPIVVLDEFTANLDPELEHEVVEAAGRLLVGRTALVIAHRPLTARLADRIVELRGGTVAGAGADRRTGASPWHDDGVDG